jgi:hypothetical protein
MPRPGAAVTCEGRSMGVAPQAGDRHVSLGGPEGMPWSGIFDIGAQVTASPPAVPEAAVATLR